MDGCPRAAGTADPRLSLGSINCHSRVRARRDRRDMLAVMASPARFPALGRSPARALITGLILTVCTALLFALGLACASAERATDAYNTGSNIALHGSLTDAATEEETTTADAPANTDLMVGTHSGWSRASTGSALCALGLLCGLLVTILARRLWNRPQVRDRVPSLIAPPCAVVAPSRFRTIAPSLTLLSVSRT